MTNSQGGAPAAALDPQLHTSLSGGYVQVTMMPSGRRAKPTQVHLGTFTRMPLVAWPGFKASRGASPVTFTAAEQGRPPVAKLEVHAEKRQCLT